MERGGQTRKHSTSPSARSPLWKCETYTRKKRVTCQILNFKLSKIKK
jgi:hypothetical protein